jgi:protocatechuate 3,4-dioxygenase beta subunit
MKRWSALAFVFALVLGAGCAGGEKPPQTFSVTGKVYDRDGKPLSGGMVQFQHATDLTLTVTGEIQPDGSFTLQTFKGKKALPGAIEGEYTATAMLPIPAGEHAPPPPITFDQKILIEAKENTIELRPSAKP